MSDLEPKPAESAVPNQGFVLSNKAYDKMKFLVRVVLPALATLYATLAGFWGFPKVEEVMGSITGLALALGLIMGKSTQNFTPPIAEGTPVGDMVVKDSQEVEGKKTVEFSLDVPPDEFLKNDVVQFRVSRGENSL
jgi:hypothetical protein